MSAPLTNNQKRYLAGLAERAFNLEAARARGRGEAVADGWREREAWRHEEVAKACRKLGLRCCSQDDYKLVEGHFLKMVGEEGRALNAFMRATTEKRRVAEWKVCQACDEAGVRLGYAEAICRAQNNGLGLQEVGEKALWRLVYTVRNRGRARRRHQSSVTSNQSSVISHQVEEVS
jgi:hypothetical protein